MNMYENIVLIVVESKLSNPVVPSGEVVNWLCQHSGCEEFVKTEDNSGEVELEGRGFITFIRCNPL